MKHLGERCADQIPFKVVAIFASDSTAVGCGKTGTAFCYNQVPTVRLFRQHPLKTGTHGMLHLSYFSDFVPSDSNNTSSSSAVVIASTAAAVLVGVEVFVSESDVSTDDLGL